MRLNRQNLDLNDAIELLEHHAARYQGNISESWANLGHSERFWVDEEIERCLDPDYFIKNYYTITTENGELKTLYPYWDQQEIVSATMKEEWEANGYCKIILLKGRQFGGSTHIQAHMFHRTIFYPHTFTLIVAQDQTVSEHVYRMSVKAYENLPWWLRPEWRYKSKSEGIDFQRESEDQVMTDPGLGSVLKVSHAQKMTGVAIGRSIRAGHYSEVSRWPDAQVFEADILPSMNARDGFYVMESTGLGKNGLFYEWWQDTVAGDTGWRALFVPTYRVRKYFLPVTPKDRIVLSEAEQQFHERVKREENYEIPLGFWKFRHFGLRRAKRNRSGFLESYPITPEEAFQSSGLCAFDKECLEEQSMKAPKNPNWAGEIKLVNNQPILEVREIGPGETLPPRKSGKGGKRLYIWEMPRSGESYYIGMDAALGNGGDFSVCEVFRAGRGMEPDVQVAEWWGWMSAKYFAHVGAALGYLYNGAQIANEYNGPGITTGDELVNIDYPDLYRPQHKDRVASTYTNYKHWVTSVKTRDLIIAEVQDALLTNTVVFNSHDLIEEHGNFSTLDEGPGRKRYEGVDSNDDGVLATGICIYCLRETLKDIKVAPPNPGERRQESSSGDGIWGVRPFEWNGPWIVRDAAMRPVEGGVFSRKEEAERAIKGLPGYSIGPHWGFAAANPFISPIHQGGGVQAQIKRTFGVPDQEIVPSLVESFNQWKKTSDPIIDRSAVSYDDNW